MWRVNFQRAYLCLSYVLFVIALNIMIWARNYDFISIPINFYDDNNLTINSMCNYSVLLLLLVFFPFDSNSWLRSKLNYRIAADAIVFFENRKNWNDFVCKILSKIYSKRVCVRESRIRNTFPVMVRNSIVIIIYLTQINQFLIVANDQCRNGISQTQHKLSNRATTTKRRNTFWSFETILMDRNTVALTRILTSFSTCVRKCFSFDWSYS